MGPFMEVSGSGNRHKFHHKSASCYAVEKPEGVPLVHHQVDLSSPFDGLEHKMENTSFPRSLDADFTEENDFSDAALKYINQVLMEDDLDDKDCMIQDSTLFVAQKSFYDILNNPPLHCQVESSSQASISYSYIDGGESCVDTCKSTEVGKISAFTESCEKSSLERQKSLQFQGDLEESKKVVPSSKCGIFDLENNRLVTAGPRKKVPKGKASPEKDEINLPNSSLRVRRRFYHQDETYLDEGRSLKHLEVYAEESVLHEMFDKILLFDGEMDKSALNSLSESHGKGQEKGSDGGTSSNRKRVSKREAVDTRSLLIQCVQAIASDDQRSADKLLKQIRLRSSPSGDASQRLAHCFANGLEARIAGTGSLNYRDLTAKNMTTSDALKAYRLYLSALPFMKTSNYFATQTISKLAEKTTSLHIIHFGIMHGVHMAPLIQHLSKRPGGSPKLRVTGIDFPKPGFRPAELIEETGLRLASYCKKLNVPFEYISIAQKWETIRLEDLKIEKDDVLVVYSCYRFHFLLDDTILENSPRDTVLNLIKRINPDVFIHGVTNGAYSSPFFISRFRDALFYFSTLFDMFDANVPSENQERMVYETVIYGKEVLNVIACEGLDRVERLETYKQWQVRTLRAGFKQLPLNQQIVKTIKAKVKSSYHKDFFVDEANQWLLHGWKGRALFALSCWKPT